jgi:hypothetical protein
VSSSDTDTSNSWIGYGLRKRQHTHEKPSYFAFQLFAIELGDFTSCTALSQGSNGNWCYEFSTPEGCKWVIWKESGSGTYDLSSRVSSSTVEVCDTYASYSYFPWTSDSASSIDISETPVLVATSATRDAAATSRGYTTARMAMDPVYQAKLRNLGKVTQAEVNAELGKLKGLTGLDLAVPGLR